MIGDDKDDKDASDFDDYDSDFDDDDANTMTIKLSHFINLGLAYNKYYLSLLINLQCKAEETILPFKANLEGCFHVIVYFYLTKY